MKKFDPIILVPDDSLAIPEVGEWSEKKYNLFGAYCDIFTTSMQRKWHNLVYIDLFAGSGLAKIRTSKKIVKGSPFIAMSLPVPFTKYILCEKDPELCAALKARIKRDYSHKNVIVIEGDCNEKILDIISYIPKPSRTNTVLSFSFIDPFSLNLHFSTVEKLGKFAMDFLILLALGMDANRNTATYIKDNSKVISMFLGNENWRKSYSATKQTNHESFVQFLAREYRDNIAKVGYEKADPFHEIRSVEKNLPLYHLAFFSKHAKGNEFWKKVQAYSTGQQHLDF